MKTTNILYWTFTALFAAAMFSTAVPNMISDPENILFISDKLGYPQYIVVFLGVAKTLGVIAILIPGFPRIKEWAYAGLFFDLIGATYSVICSEGQVHPSMAFMLIFFGLGILSYVYYHKKLRAVK